MRFLILIFLSISLQAQTTFVPALKPELKLKPTIAGNILLGELNCTSCHESQNADILNKHAPILDNISKRIKQSYIIDYLVSPQKTKAGTSMPDVLHKLPAEKQKVVTKAI